MVIVNEPYTVIILKHEKEVAREVKSSDVAYCDDCDKEIPNYESYHSNNKCCVCEKQICDDHRYPFPSAETQEGNGDHAKYICERCRTTYEKEIKDFILYLTTRKKLEDAVETFQKEYGQKKIAGFSPLYFSSYIYQLAGEIRKKQARRNADKARRRERK